MREFEGRTLLIATQHAKEQVMAPLLEKALGVICRIPRGFNTDLLGTFSGEYERQEDPLKTARKKCRLAMNVYGSDLAIASEGSFGMHPTIFFCYANEELVLLVDKKNDLEISAVITSTKTNFNGQEVKDMDGLLDFAERVNFPSHGLILRRSKDDFKTIIKGIQNPKQLSTAFDNLLDKYGSVYVQTDMRAMYNPMRMAVIEQATDKLIDKIKSRCPVCNTPGFGVMATKEGLPCGLCGLPTRSLLAYVYQCLKCDFENEQLHPNQIEVEEPKYCDYCNP